LPKVILLWSEIPSGKCAKFRTVAASNNRDHPTRTLSLSPLASTINRSLASQALLEVTHQDRSIGIRRGRSYFFSLRLRSRYQFSECGSGYKSRKFLNLRIRLLFRLWLPSIQFVNLRSNCAWVAEPFSKWWGGTTARQNNYRKILWFELETVTSHALKYDVIVKTPSEGLIHYFRQNYSTVITYQ